MKILRYLLVIAISVAMFTLFFAVVPTIAWIFGGSFIETAQSVPHVIICGIGSIVAIGHILQESLDSDLNFKP